MVTPELVHDPEEYRVPLHNLRFLLGHFRGEGHYARGATVFYKEMSGMWEANGRFIGLRMSVTYPLADGRQDVHEAFIMVGTHPTSGQFEAHAYTDSGTIQTYQLEWNDNVLSFADRPPTAHGKSITRARKSFTPTADGFEESVEVDLGNDTFVPYSMVKMLRVER
jgi:hypothetical protein